MGSFHRLVLKERVRHRHFRPDWFKFCIVAFSPDATTILFGSNVGTMGMWDYYLRSAGLGHGRSGLSVAYSPDGKHMVAGGYGSLTPSAKFHAFLDLYAPERTKKGTRDTNVKSNVNVVV